MATPFAARPVWSLSGYNPNSRTLVFLPVTGSFHRGTHRALVRCKGCRIVSSWSYDANRSSFANVFAIRSGKTIVVKELLKWRRYATVEEVAAVKSSVETDAKSKMDKTIETLRATFNSVRTDRANPAILDKIQVEYYGSPVNLKSIAQISTPDSSSLLVQPYDKSSIKLIEKAIVSSNLDLTPTTDEDVLRLSLPPLTSERRKELTKMVAKQAEEGKVALRNIRRDALKVYDKLKKEKKLSEDNARDLSADIQEITDEYVKKIETIHKQKEKELLTV